MSESKEEYSILNVFGYQADGALSGIATLRPAPSGGKIKSLLHQKLLKFLHLISGAVSLMWHTESNYLFRG